jgi:hypothetical protein
VVGEVIGDGAEEVIVDEVVVVVVAEHEAVPTLFSSPTDIQAYLSQKAKTNYL